VRNLTKREIKKRGIIRRRILFAMGIIGVLYLVIPLLLGDMGVLKYFSMLRTYHQAKTEIRELDRKNKLLSEEIEALRSDPVVIEKVAREELGLVKKGELVYKFRKPKE